MRHNVDMSAMEPKPCGKKPIHAPDDARLQAEHCKKLDDYYRNLPKPSRAQAPMAAFNRWEW